MSTLLARFWSALRLIFFQYFFRVFLLFLSIGQWTCIAWLARMAVGISPPLWVHVVGAVAFYATNRSIVLRRRSGYHGPPGRLLQVYSAAAFTAAFCFVYFLALGALWLVARGTVAAANAAIAPAVEFAVPGGGLDVAFRWLSSLGMTAIACLFAHGYVFGQRQLRVSRLSLSAGAPPGRSEPVRIVHITDIHVGQNLTLDELEHFVARVNELKPDLVCITGDIADSPFADTRTFFPVLGRIDARHGVFAILGNHDHYAGADHVSEELARWTPIRLLRDEAATVEVAGGRLHVIGLDDRGPDWARGFPSDERLTRLLAEAPAGVPVVLLVHRPDTFRHAAAARVALTLAGHTHGGQLAIPWFGGRRRNLAEFITPFDRGLYTRDGCHLYVNSGLGVTAQRIRLFTPREIALIELGLQAPPA